MGRRHVTPSTVQYWARPQYRPSLLDAPPPLHRKPFRQQLRRDAAQVLGPVRRWTEEWGGAAVDATCRIFAAAGALIAGLSMLTVVIGMAIFVMGAGR